MKREPLFGIDMDGTVEVKVIWSCVLLVRFTEKREFIMSCCILNFSSYFSAHSDIPETIFTIISSNVSSSDLDVVVSGGGRLSFCISILSIILPTLSANRFIALFFFLDLHFPKYWARYFSFPRTFHSFHFSSL